MIKPLQNDRWRMGFRRRHTQHHCTAHMWRPLQRSKGCPRPKSLGTEKRNTRLVNVENTTSLPKISVEKRWFTRISLYTFLLFLTYTPLESIAITGISIPDTTQPIRTNSLIRKRIEGDCIVLHEGTKNLVTQLGIYKENGVIDRRLQVAQEGVEECGEYDTDEPEGQEEEETEEGKADRVLHLLEKRWSIFNTLNFSRSSPRESGEMPYSSIRNYCVEADETLSPAHLAQDALRIHRSIRGEKAKKATSILCVALMDVHHHIKKFAFCSADRPMRLEARIEAEHLGYDVVRTERSHAEGQFLQFLHRRNLVRPGLYTHVLAIGCSRRFCAKCDCLLQLTLGRNYAQIAAVIEEEEILNDRATVDTNTVYRNYHIPDLLLDLLSSKTCKRVMVTGEAYYSGSRKGGSRKIVDSTRKSDSGEGGGGGRGKRKTRSRRNEKRGRSALRRQGSHEEIKRDTSTEGSGSMQHLRSRKRQVSPEKKGGV